LAAGHKTTIAKTIHFILLSPIARTTAFPFRLSRFFFHPHRIVGSGATESALGKNLTYLNQYSTSRMCLAVILAGFDAFLACFACHLGSPPSLRSSRNLMVSVVFFG
jgi:hypothetical protein